MADVRVPADRQLGRQRRGRRTTSADGQPQQPARSCRPLEQFAGWRQYVDPNTDDKAFATGRVALSLGRATGCTTTTRRRSASDLVVLPLPNFGDGPKSGQGSLSLGHQRRHQERAGRGRKFLDFLMSDGPVTAMTDANAAPPGTKTVSAPEQALQARRSARAVREAAARETCGTGAPTQDCVAIAAAGQRRPRPVISQEFSQGVLHGLQRRRRPGRSSTRRRAPSTSTSRTTTTMACTSPPDRRGVPRESPPAIRRHLSDPTSGRPSVHDPPPSRDGTPARAADGRAGGDRCWSCSCSCRSSSRSGCRCTTCGSTRATRPELDGARAVPAHPARPAVPRRLLPRPAQQLHVRGRSWCRCRPAWRSAWRCC